MSDLDRLIASRDELLDWVAGNAPRLHQTYALRTRIRHAGPFSECDDEPCSSAHMAMVRAYESSEGEYREPSPVGSGS